MSRINLVDPSAATGSAAGHLGQIKSAFGMVPNMFRAVANSPAALASLWGSFAALGGGRLGARLGEQIAVAIANANNCEYCLSAHTALGRKTGAGIDEMSEAQHGRSADPRTAAILGFALRVVDRRGGVDADEVHALRAAGLDDEEIVEVLAHIALNLFTNYVNVALDVPVDFPNIRPKRAA